MQRSRAFVFTLNNYSSVDEVYLQETLAVRYIVYGREKAPETGTPHLQGFLYFAQPRSLSSVRKLRKWHVEVAKGDVLQNGEYAKKDDDWFEKGDRPLTQQEKGDCERNRYKRAFELAMEGNYAAIDSDILVRHYSTLKRFRGELTAPKDLPYLPLCVFIHGPTGTGKSRIVQQLVGDVAYRKEPNTKWFTGYEHQPVVWIDEIELIDPGLQSLYKRLCDHYVCAVESKGGNISIRPKVIFFTSNYTPQQVFLGAYEPMRRRLQVFEFTHSNKDAVQTQVTEAFEEFVEARCPEGFAQGRPERMDSEQARPTTPS